MKMFLILCLFGFLGISCGQPETPDFEGISSSYSEQQDTEGSSTSRSPSTSSSPSSRNPSSTTASNGTSAAPVAPAATAVNSAESMPNETSPETENANTFLVINEILYDAAGSDTDGNEFIELYGNSEMDISGYQILIVNGSDGQIIDTINIPQAAKTGADGLYLIADLRTNSSSASNILGADFLDNFDPQNGPDAIQILSARGELKDSLAYGEGVLAEASNGLILGEGSFAPDVASGHSLSRTGGADTNNNAADFSDLETPSPGIL